jgi:acid phosphatase class B
MFVGEVDMRCNYPRAGRWAAVWIGSIDQIENSFRADAVVALGYQIDDALADGTANEKLWRERAAATRAREHVGLDHADRMVAP